MGIKFRCPACDKKLHVKAFLAGKRGVCPKCGGKVWIPLSSEDAAPAAAGSVDNESAAHGAVGGSPPRPTRRPGAVPAESGSLAVSSAGPAPPAEPVADGRARAAGRDPIADAPGAVWYVRPPSGGQFGPADATVMRRWLEEGRIGAEALVWREGWAEWNLARSVFPLLDEPVAVVPAVPAAVSAAPHEDAVVVSGQRATTVRRSPAPRSRGLTRKVAVVIALCILCVALGVALFLVLQRTS